MRHFLAWFNWQQRKSPVPVWLTVLLVLGGSVGSSLAGSGLSYAQFVPSDRGMPGRREGGGTRGNCLTQASLAGQSSSVTQAITAQPSLATQPGLTALMPDSNLGQTMAERPTFFWYIPQSAAAAEFVLLDANNTEQYKTLVPVPSQSGVVSLTLPDSVTLEVGQSYRWYFSLVCNPLDRSADTYTSGWVERIAPDPALLQTIAAAPPAEQARLYAQASLWYEALATLAQLRQSQPQDAALVTQWQTLLKSVGLEQIADQPLL
jgi:hypothetical protein